MNTIHNTDTHTTHTHTRTHTLFIEKNNILLLKALIVLFVLGRKKIE